ncbi:MAG: hypothetical protein JW982_15845 [Spirochaetes bacterium]|nr:hypothetical protein [Spirochaetota bacterium]
MNEILWNELNLPSSEIKFADHGKVLTDAGSIEEEIKDITKRYEDD